MKQLLSGIVFIAFGQNGLSQTVNWGTPVTVAMGSMYNNLYPRVALTTGNIPLVIWENDDNSKVYAARWTGSSFGTPMVLNPTGVNPFIAEWAGAEVAASGDTVFVTFSTIVGGEGEVYTVRSIDGGMSFQDTVRVDPIDSDVPRFPTVAIGLNGNPVVSYMRLDDTFGNAEYAVARSMNGENSYMLPVIASDGATGTVCDCCPATIETSGNRHAVLYRNNDNNIREMWASFSTDGSANFPVSSEIDQTNWMLMSCPSSGPSGVIVGDTLVSTFMSDGEVFFSTVNINDQQFGLHRQIFPAGTGMENFPIIAGSGDTLGIVWQGPNGGTKLFFTCSTTGAAGLGVNIDTLELGMGNQTRPDLQFANGKFHLVYSDEMGTNVRYVTGIVETTAGTQEQEPAGFSFSATVVDGAIELAMQSKLATSASLRLVNSLGQSVAESSLQIHTGMTHQTIDTNMEKGVYYLVLTTKEGVELSQKILINR